MRPGGTVASFVSASVETSSDKYRIAYIVLRYRN
jgi:hypothetical protein